MMMRSEDDSFGTRGVEGYRIIGRSPAPRKSTFLDRVSRIPFDTAIVLLAALVLVIAMVAIVLLGR